MQLDSRQVSSLVTVPLPSFCSRVTSDITKVQASSSKVSRVLKSQCQPTAARFDALDASPSQNVTAARECCITRLRPGVTSRCHLQDNTETFECTRYTHRAARQPEVRHCVQAVCEVNTDIVFRRRSANYAASARALPQLLTAFAAEHCSAVTAACDTLSLVCHSASIVARFHSGTSLSSVVRRSAAKTTTASRFHTVSRLHLSAVTPTMIASAL